MPQEALTWKFFQNGAASKKIERPDEFEALLSRWLSPADGFEAYREAFVRLRYEEDPTILIEELVGLGQEAAGCRLSRRPFPPTNGNGRH